jgi:hypothetical protein
VARGLEATGLTTSRGKTTHFTVLVRSVADPVDAGVVTDSLVLDVNTDYFEVLVSSVGVDPVRVKYTSVGALTANTAFGDNLEAAWGLEVVDTLVLGLTVHNTLGALHLAATTADGNTLDGVSLLVLVSKLAGLVGAGGALALVDVGKLTVLPGAKAEKEPHHVTLLLLPYFFEVFVGTHGCG